METPEIQEEAPKTKRALIAERILAVNPEANIEDDEEMYGHLGEIMDGHGKTTEELEGYRQNSSKLAELMDKDPRAAQMLIGMGNGENPVVFLMQNYGDEFKAALENPEMADQLGEAHSKWIDKIQSDKNFEEESAENLQNSLLTLEELQNEQGFSDEEADGIISFLFDKIVSEGLKNNFSRETFEYAIKARNYDTDMSKKDEAIAGEVESAEKRGANTKIEEKLAGEEGGEAIIPPTLGGGGAAGMEVEETPKIKRPNPFVAGGEKEVEDK
jgi:hypothetical protein